MELVIDFSAIAHDIRRWWWRRRRKVARQTQCIGCGKELTTDEAFHYIFHCERCEAIESAAWDQQ